MPKTEWDVICEREAWSLFDALTEWHALLVARIGLGTAEELALEADREAVSEQFFRDCSCGTVTT